MIGWRETTRLTEQETVPELASACSARRVPELLDVPKGLHRAEDDVLIDVEVDDPRRVEDGIVVADRSLLGDVAVRGAERKQAQGPGPSQEPFRETD